VEGALLLLAVSNVYESKTRIQFKKNSQEADLGPNFSWKAQNKGKCIKEKPSSAPSPS